GYDSVVYGRNDMTTADPREVHESRPPRSINRFVSALGGVIFLAVGALSFTALGTATMIGDNDQLFLGVFQVNGLVILIRILMGLALLLATRDTVFGSARTNIGVGVVALLVAASSPFLDTLVEGGILALT